ncbi:hypothetical protein AB6N24_21555 [Cellulomonas sp. 179-A 4D5 NHS]|uniref:hypothetical protein n=1 Tax=Cellulomonas sp. 179-A 4D5 NHS TaxID=3142378 RepID=UPI0039A05084
MLSTSQQVGGAVGTALLNTVAAGATAAWATSHLDGTPAQAAVHGYTTAFWWAAAAAVLAAVALQVCVRTGRPGGADEGAADVAAPERAVMH